MALTVGSVIARFTSDVSDFRDGLAKVKGDVSTFQSTLTSVGGAMTKTGAIATAALTLPIVGVGIAAAKAAADYEQSMVAFTTMLGSAEKAAAMLGKITDMAMKTPFQLKDVETGAKQLLAYGISAESVLSDLTMLGNIASGVGMDKLPNLILAFGQVNAATRLTGMELRQFTEAGVPMLQTLAEVMGKPVKEVQDMVSAGEVGFDKVRLALGKLTGEGGKFFNLMEKQSQTTAGQISNFKDNVDKLLRSLGAELLPTINKVVVFLNDLMTKFQQLSPETRQTIVTIAAIVAVIGPLLVILGTLITAIGTVAGVLGATAAVIAGVTIPVWAVIAAIAALIAIGVALYQNWDLIKQGAIDLFNTVITALTTFYYENVLPILTAVGAAFTWLWETIIKPVIDMIIAYYTAWYNALSWVWNNLIYPILLLISAVFLRIFYEIFMWIKTNLENAWNFWKAIFTVIWEWVKPWLDTLSAYINTVFNIIKNVVSVVWTWIKDHIINKFTEAKDGVVNVLTNIYNSLRDKFNAAVTFVADAWQRLKNAIIQPFEEAKRKVEEIANAIKAAAEKINPFHRESPSLVDNVRNGVEAIKDAYNSLGFDLQPPTLAGAGMGVGGDTIVINMAGANITDPSIAENYAEMIGDTIIRRLGRTVKT